MSCVLHPASMAGPPGFRVPWRGQWCSPGWVGILLSSYELHALSLQLAHSSPLQPRTTTDLPSLIVD